MLDNTSKRKIDSARNILVGKVPDPKAQVEQITTALIYKFMDDMDLENEEAGLSAQFFIDDYAKYSWRKLMDNRLSGQERMDLYVEAVANIQKAKNIPQLFRDIFKGAFLPFRDPRTLSLFLKEINEFSYDNSENLGNAFEYLLSILGSQGDAGQFRTPRHIIDFIVEVVDPKKNETILDPACGTAGFLISAYKHILKTNSSNFKPEEEKAEDKIVQGDTATETIIEEKANYSGDLLSPDDKTKLTQNIAGYDISPDMVKLALVNLYLHGFSDPKIFEYDTLSSDKRWDEHFDVILANPPFMTPKGGIVPHKKFSIQANRAEVLFVDYIAEHLNINGRAGIIVPEGIIFQSANAYKQLRKNLIENWGLYAVVSLPGGVFQPYSGVKTSILLMDREFAKKTDEILFLQIENDGFDLGAQRRKIDKNDLPQALEVLEKFKEKNYFSFGDLEDYGAMATSAPKSKIVENGDYNLTGERYKVDLSESFKANFETIAKALEPHQKILKEISEQHQKQAEQIQKMVQPVFEQLNKQQEFINKTFENIQAPIQQMKQAFKSSNYSGLLELAQKAIEEINTSKWPMVELGEVCEVLNGYAFKSKNYVDDGVRIMRITNVQKGEIVDANPKFYPIESDENIEKYILKQNDLLLSLTGNVGRVGLVKKEFLPAALNQRVACLRINSEKINIRYLFNILNSDNFEDEAIKSSSGIAQKNLSTEWLKSFQIPLPPLEVQEQIVAEIEQYQKVINGAKQVVESWKPNFRIDPSWEMVKVGEIADLEYGIGESAKESGEYRYIRITDIDENGNLRKQNKKYIEKNTESEKYELKKGDLLIARTGATYGKTLLFNEDEPSAFAGFLIRINFDKTVLSEYFWRFAQSEQYWNQARNLVSGGGQPQFNANAVKEIKVPLPPLEVQEQIVAEVEAEQNVVDANKKLIEKMKKKVEAKIGEVWGDEV